MKIKILKPSKAELLRQYQQLYDESTIVEVEFNSLKQEVLNRQVFIMADDEEYCLRLEKIIDKQDGLLNHYDAKFNQQNSLNDALSRQNKILKEDLQKHKNLLKDMKKNIDQHKMLLIRGCDAKFLVVFCVFNFLIIFSYFSCFLCLFRCIFFLDCVRLRIV